MNVKDKTKSIAFQMFGKQHKDLTKDERRQYYTARQKEYRKKPEVLEKCRAYSLRYAREHSKALVPRDKSFVWVHFGKSWKSLTSKEKYKYQKMRKNEILGRN